MANKCAIFRALFTAESRFHLSILIIAAWYAKLERGFFLRSIEKRFSQLGRIFISPAVAGQQ